MKTLKKIAIIALSITLMGCGNNEKGVDGYDKITGTTYANVTLGEEIPTVRLRFENEDTAVSIYTFLVITNGLSDGGVSDCKILISNDGEELEYSLSETQKASEIEEMGLPEEWTDFISENDIGNGTVLIQDFVQKEAMVEIAEYTQEQVISPIVEKYGGESDAESIVKNEETATPKSTLKSTPKPTMKPTEKPTEKPTAAKVYLQEAEIAEAYKNPSSFKGQYVKLTGKVFGKQESDERYCYFQMYNDIENLDRNTYVRVKLEDGKNIESGSYVTVDGVISGDMGGFNAFGAYLSMLYIEADTITIGDYISVVSPTIKESSLNLEVNQYGYSVVINKVEFAEKETRVYVTISNNGSATFRMYDFNAKIVQNSTQYETENNYDADYPEIQSELLQGAVTSGIILFPAIDQNANFRLYLDGSSENWDEDIETYLYDIYP